MSFKKWITLLAGLTLVGALSHVYAQSYGGYINVAGRNVSACWQPVHVSVCIEKIGLLTDFLLESDLTKGPRGTGEFTFANQSNYSLNGLRGSLLESWEQPTAQSLVFKVRKGVHFHNKPPANGRELNARDIVRDWEILTADTRAGGLYEAHKRIKWTARDDWTIDVEMDAPDVPGIWAQDLLLIAIPAPEWKEIEDKMDDWQTTKNSGIYTGPFMLEDHVDLSVTTYIKNPDYWGKDVFNTDDQVPYVDGMRIVDFADAAAKMAALRSGKLDILSMFGLSGEEKDAVEKTNPEIKFVPGFVMGLFTWVRADLAPWNDVRVRYAAHMAINYEEVRDDFYKGNACFPSMPQNCSVGERLSMDWLKKYRPDLAKLFEYHPDEAKKLLADAGYPNGFDTELIVSHDWAEHFELMTTYLEEVGIRVKLKTMEQTMMYSSIHPGPEGPDDKVYSGMGAHDTGCNNLNMACLSKWHGADAPFFGAGFVKGTIADNKMRALQDAYKSETDPIESKRIWTELYLHWLELAWGINWMGVNTYNHWQPWVKGYEGAGGYESPRLNLVKYYWIDADMKKQMSGRDPDE